MGRCVTLGLAMLMGLAASSARAAEPAAALPALAYVPKDAVAFVHIPNLKTLQAELQRFTTETGWQVAKTGMPVTDQIVRRTGLSAGLDWDAPAALAYLDPKQYPNRYTVYVLPVADWDALLKAAKAEPMTADIYALTATGGPCFLLKSGRFAVVTSSVRTLKDVRGATGIVGSLASDTRARAVAAAGPMIYVDIHRLVVVYQKDIAAWLKASSGQVISMPQVVPYSDIMTTYILGIADLLDQIETLEGTFQFGPEGLSSDLSVRFVDKASLANFLTAQAPGAIAPPPVGDFPITSCVSVQLDPKSRTDIVMRVVAYFLEKAPRPQPLQEPTKEHVTQAVETLAKSLGPQMVMISASASMGMGLETDVTILDLQSPDDFKRGVSLFAAAWGELAEEMDLYAGIHAMPDASEIAGVPVSLYMPRFRFGVNPQQSRFTEGLKALYGPEGLAYRIAVVGQKAVIATGSDLALFKKVVENLKAGQAPVPPSVAQLQGRMPPKLNLWAMSSPPMFLRGAFLAGGTPPERVGEVNPGKELAGFGLAADGPSIRINSYLPHEQLRLAKELLDRVSPELSKKTESLFEPTREEPPAPGPKAKGAE